MGFLPRWYPGFSQDRYLRLDRFANFSLLFDFELLVMIEGTTVRLSPFQEFMNLFLQLLTIQMWIVTILCLCLVTPQNNAHYAMAKEGVKTVSGTNSTTASANALKDSKVADGVAVDWSSWAGRLADRWYDKLIALEKQSGRHFRTLRPARIKFTCYADGTIGQISVYRSCGIPAYDKMQIEALKQTIPLPSFPVGSKRKSYTLLQGWESHPRVLGEPEFTPGSYGKNFPVEKVNSKQGKHH